MEMQVAEILKGANIHTTAIRLQIAGILQLSNRALSTKEIEERMGITPDRVTLYRTLKLFVDKEILHKIEVSDSLVVYRLKLDAETISAEHPHFHCTTCNAIYCLTKTPLLTPVLPEGFEHHHNKMLVDGTCKICNEKR